MRQFRWVKLAPLSLSCSPFFSPPLSVSLCASLVLVLSHLFRIRYKATCSKTLSRRDGTSILGWHVGVILGAELLTPAQSYTHRREHADPHVHLKLNSTSPSGSAVDCRQTKPSGDNKLLRMYEIYRTTGPRTLSYLRQMRDGTNGGRYAIRGKRDDQSTYKAFLRSHQDNCFYSENKSKDRDVLREAQQRTGVVLKIPSDVDSMSEGITGTVCSTRAKRACVTAVS